MMPAFSAQSSTDTRNHDSLFPSFQRNNGMAFDAEDDIRNGLANVSPHESHSVRGGSPSGGEYDNMFMDIAQPDAEASNDPVPSLEHETSHASEALDMIRTASHDSANEHAELEDGDNVSKHFDEFLNGDEQS